MKKMKFAVLGTGFWSFYQLSGWMELEGVEPIAFCNRTITKAAALGSKFGVRHVYDDVDELLKKHAHELDFVDIITDVDTHPVLTEKVASYGINVICQKPMAPRVAQAEAMLSACSQAGVKLFIHENFRWQAPIRKLNDLLKTDVIGIPFKAQVSFCSGFPVFQNQPFLKELPEFILMDIGTHVLDICRFLFGEADSLYCRTMRINQEIKGEDVANVFMHMTSGISCYAEMSYASVPAREPFPQTLIKIEGSKGTLELMHDYLIRITTRQGSSTIPAGPSFYAWANPSYALVHASIVECNRNILEDLQGTGTAETTGNDNLETLKLVDAAYRSARENRVITFHQLS